VDTYGRMGGMPTNPPCPQCSRPLWEVRWDPNGMLNKDQFDSIRAGDWYCEHCKGAEPRTGYKYYWTRDLLLLPPSL
jgi:hypothetical protein